MLLRFIEDSKKDRSTVVSESLNSIEIREQLWKNAVRDASRWGGALVTQITENGTNGKLVQDFLAKQADAAIEAGGATITFLRGQTVSEEGHAFHANYSVAPREILSLLDREPSPVSEGDTPAKQRPVGTIVGRMIEALPFARRNGP